MLERDLGLTGVSMDGQEYVQYTMGRVMSIIIDLYDPTILDYRSAFDAYFREKLKSYTLVHYNGHSSYGSKHLLDDPGRSQMGIRSSCCIPVGPSRTIRDKFFGRRRQSDPQGFALADVVATGKSSYPSGSPKTLRVLISSLFESMEAIDAGRSDEAVDWITIAEGMKGSTWGDILYGIAGVRANTWRP